MSGSMAPPATPGLACRLWSASESENKCISPNRRGTQENFCEYCQRMDGSTLESFTAPNDTEGHKLIKDIRTGREERAHAALGNGKVICAMENPKFDGAEWRRLFKPGKKCSPCLWLEIPGQHEYCLCNSCITNEKETEWYQRWVMDSASLDGARPDAGNLVAWIGFKCVWNNPYYLGHEWRDLWKGRDHKVIVDDIPVVPGCMCAACVESMDLPENRDAAHNLSRYFWDNGGLRSRYPDKKPWLDTVDARVQIHPVPVHASTSST